MTSCRKRDQRRSDVARPLHFAISTIEWAQTAFHGPRQHQRIIAARNLSVAMSGACLSSTATPSRREMRRPLMSPAR